MKKITIFFAIIGMIILNACQRNEIIEAPQQDNDTIAEVFELKGVNFILNGTQYEIYRVLNPNIFASDNILIYRLSGTVNPTTPIWQLIPRTLFLPPQGELDYDFDFSKEDFTIYANGNYNLNLTPTYINNQTFRIVVIPGSFRNRMKPVDFSDYHAVLKRYNISDKKLIQL